MNQLELFTVVADFAEALCAIDRSGVAHKYFQPGIGPHGEADAVRQSLEWLRLHRGEPYTSAMVKRAPDLLIPELWQLEFKIARPYGDNGKLAEHWSENLLHPYAGNTSMLGDCLKLQSSPGPERRAVVVMGFEHNPPLVDLDILYRAFELLAKDLLNIRLGLRVERRCDGLVHPVHQLLSLAAWEVLPND